MKVNFFLLAERKKNKPLNIVFFLTVCLVIANLNGWYICAAGSANKFLLIYLCCGSCWQIFADLLMLRFLLIIWLIVLNFRSAILHLLSCCCWIVHSNCCCWNWIGLFAATREDIPRTNDSGCWNLPEISCCDEGEYRYTQIFFY